VLKKLGTSTKFNSPIIISIISTGSSWNRHEPDVEVSFADEGRFFDPFAFMPEIFLSEGTPKRSFYINK
jgi:hypothetical protein